MNIFIHAVMNFLISNTGIEKELPVSSIPDTGTVLIIYHLSVQLKKLKSYDF